MEKDGRSRIWKFFWIEDFYIIAEASRESWETAFKDLTNEAFSKNSTIQEQSPEEKEIVSKAEQKFEIPQQKKNYFNAKVVDAAGTSMISFSVRIKQAEKRGREEEKKLEKMHIFIF